MTKRRSCISPASLALHASLNYLCLGRQRPPSALKLFLLPPYTPRMTLMWSGSLAWAPVLSTTSPFSFHLFHCPLIRLLWVLLLPPLPTPSTKHTIPPCFSLQHIKTSLTWRLQFSEAAIFSLHHPLMLRLQEKMMYGLMSTVSIRPLAFLFHYRPQEISTAKVLLSCQCSCFIVVISKNIFRFFLQSSHLLLSTVSCFSKFCYVFVMSFAHSSLYSQYILLPQQHVH